MKKKKQEQQINYLDLIPVKAEGLKWHKDFRDRVILEVKNGSFSYGQREILRNVSFCLEKQKIMTILGPNGVGKTTLLKCIMGFLPWNRGEAFKRTFR